MTHPARPYQTDCIKAIAKGFSDGFKKQLIVMATGGGKTYVFSHVAKRFLERRNEKTLILAHREELTNQAVDKLRTFTGIDAGLEKADSFADRKSNVVVASIQTLQSDRLKSWAKDHFGLIIIDEAHHVMADSYQNILKHFNSRQLGVTATPGRSDKKNLATHFDNMAYEIGMLDLIGQGFLCPLRVRSVPLKIDLEKVEMTGGDYDATQLDAAITPYLKEIAKYIATQCHDRKKIIAFLPLIQTSKRFVEECLAAGIPAKHVDGESKDRKAIMAGFESDDTRVLSNAMIATEGWDCPIVDTVLPLRPTKSTELLKQMVGRVLRVHPDKDYSLFLDFLWLHEKHDLAKPASLVARTKDEEEAITKALEQGDDKDLGEAVEDAKNEREAALIRQIAANARKAERFIPIEQVGALLKDKKIMDYAPVFGWETAPVSAAQKNVLDRFGLKCTTKGEASMVMNRLFSRSKEKLATVKQLIWLVRFNHPTPETCTAKEAKIFLDERFKKKD